MTLPRMGFMPADRQAAASVLSVEDVLHPMSRQYWKDCPDSALQPTPTMSR